LRESGLRNGGDVASYEPGNNPKPKTQNPELAPPSRFSRSGLQGLSQLALWTATADFIPVAVLSPYPTREARAAYVDRRLGELYPNPAIPLDHTDAYTLMIAVLLSAQCTDKRVNLTTPKLFALASTPEQMVKLSVEEINAIVRPCGLAPRKAQAIRALSAMLLARHGGKVPRTFAELEELPGIGHKSASVVMTQAFGVPSFPVDTHIHRLAQRWRLTNGRSVEQTEADLRRLFPESRWNPLHLRIIYYGREHCTAWGCDGTRCEICRTLFPNRKRPAVTRKA
jgi:endonuclease-3